MIKKKIDYSTKKILITDFSTSKLSNDNVQDKVKCESLYNFNIEDGMLKKKMGVGFLKVYAYNDSESVQYRLNTDALGLSYYNKVMHFKQYFPESGDTTHRLLIHGSDGKLYLYQMFSNLNTPNWAYELQFENIPAVLEYKKDGLDSILISAKDKLVVWSTGRTPYEITGIPTITSMCVCNDELFCTIAGESDKIWYTSNLDPESLGAGSDEAKYIIMEGSAGDGRKIVKLKENMFVFCDYGIGRVNTYAKEEPTYNQIYLTNSQIRPETVEVCGDCVMFLTRNGLYKFNGTSVTKIDVVDSLLRNGYTEYSVAATLNDDYYFALSTKFPGNEGVGCEFNNKYKNNAVVKINIRDYSFEVLRGIDVKNMLALRAGVDEKIILTFNTFYDDVIGQITDDGLYFDGYFPGCYNTNYITPEKFQSITIRKIKVDSVGVGSVVIIVNNKRYTFSLEVDGIAEFMAIIPCEKFKIKISSQDPTFNMRALEIEYEK